jgi:3-oxoadipate enol-lactonase
MQIESNGSTFHCRIDGHGPWVMLSHGLATDLTMWDELTEALKDRYRVLRYDARGHGGSAAPEGDYSLDLLVADALGLVLDHPQRLRSAVIADSRHTTQPEFTEAWLGRAEAVRKAGIEAIVESTVDRWSSAGLAERRPATITRMETMIRRTSPNGYRGCAAALARLNYGHRLGEIETPTLLICGSEDHGAPPENTRQMHAAIKGSRFVEIKQAGHISNIEQPAIFAKAVLDFFGDVDRTAGALPAG